MEELYAFSSERKMASVLVREADGLVLYNKARTWALGVDVAFPLSGRLPVAENSTDVVGLLSQHCTRLCMVASLMLGSLQLCSAF